MVISCHLTRSISYFVPRSYFEDDDSELTPNTNGSASRTPNDKPTEEEDEEDPLDAFMADIAVRKLMELDIVEDF